jgi:hypothetical protein
MSESRKVQKYELMCIRLAAECRGLAADFPELGLRAHFLRLASKWTELADSSCPALTHDMQADRDQKSH